MAITPADVARLPSPGGAIPVAVSFSPDDRTITFLHSPGRNLTRVLEALDLGTGRRWTVEGTGDTEEDLAPEEKLRRERARDLGVGVTRYLRARHAETLLLPRPDGLWARDTLEGESRLVVGAAEGALLDPQLSPGGTEVAFVREGELHVSDLAGGATRRITSGADPAAGLTHGLAEFVAQEEMGREHGYWWSRDGRWLAWTEVDESPVAPLRILHAGREEHGPAAEELHRYPFAGEANATVRLAVTPAGGGPARWFDLGDGDHYLARAHWMPDGSLVAEVESRDQLRLDLWRFDPATGARRHLLAEESDVWINLHSLFRPLDAGGFVWGSERSGFRHLLLCDDDGDVVRALTAGEWMVDGLDGLDEVSGVVYFSATEASPLERHLYAAPLAGDVPPRRITAEQGTHQVVVDHRGEHFVDTFGALERPWTVTVRALATGAIVHTVHDERDPRIEALGLVAPELFTTGAPDGTVLHGACYPPRGAIRTGGACPVIVSVYGGPHAQRVTNSWSLTADLRAQLLRQEGFAVVMLDNRGSARRGLAFEGAVRHDLGRLEVESYGGYLAAMALARAPDVFVAGVAGAPVTSWDGYDTHYTERYMSTPTGNPDGYRSSSVMTHAAQVRGRLLLVHGLVDENVHFRHTARLVQALIDAGRPHELMVFPKERHVPRAEKDRAFMEARILAFFCDALS